jgi:predicted TPR repeat methyltransferase
MPQDAVRFQTAMARHAAGEYAFAVGEYRAILAPDPSDINVLYHLGIAEHQLRNLDQAAIILEQMLRLAPDFAEGWQSLGAVQLDRGRADAAVDAYRKALALKPALYGARLRLVAALLEKNLAGETIDPVLAGLRMTPAEPRLWRCLEMCLNSILASRSPGEWRSFMPVDFPQLAAQAVSSGCVLRGSALNGILLNFLTDELERCSDSLGDALDVLGNPAYAEVEVLSFPLEQALSRIRRDALAAFHADNIPSLSASIVGLVSLANIQFRHEYVAFTSATENRQAKILEDRIEADLKRNVVNAFDLALSACYRPLHALRSAGHLRPDAIPAGCEALESLLRQQVWEPLQERRLASSIPRITPIRQATSLVVRGMYEQNPYPRWRNLPIHIDPAGSLAAHLELRLPGIRVPAAPAQGHFEVLIAGCGTGRQPVATATRLPFARITAVDLSLASLAYAERKAKELGLPQIKFAQADILELGTLQQRFHYIECAGVLHHLADPLEGLRVLSSLLEKGGIILLALYSRRAREHYGILRAQQFAKDRCCLPGADDMRELRLSLMSPPHDRPGELILTLRDFYFLSQCRDLLLHEMEHCYAPPEVGRLCSDAGLKFLGFEEPAPGSFERYSLRFPEDSTRTDLEHWAQMELAEPGLFIGMYTFFAQKPWSD